MEMTEVAPPSAVCDAGPINARRSIAPSGNRIRGGYGCQRPSRSRPVAGPSERRALVKDESCHYSLANICISAKI